LSVDPLVPLKESTIAEKTSHISNTDPIGKLNSSNNSHFSNKINQILSEVEQNIVQTSEPGYQYLVNMLNNYQPDVENPEQLQEIVRKEEFYLSRRKPFMESAEFQSHSQVLSQFSNIISRQQYSI
jgi:t-SNARE complex subunit (syntaxin)